MSVYEIIARSADLWPEKTAISDEYGDIDYGTLFRETESLKNELLKSGVGPGQGVGLMARNGRGFIISAFAVLGCGATLLPIFHQIRRSELDDLIKVSGIHAVIDDGSGIRPVEDALYTDIPWPDTLRLAWTYVSKTKPFIDFIEDPAFVRFTSGTTGTSKGVILTHEGILERIEAANTGLALSSEDTVICVLPMAFHFLVSIVLYLKVGAKIVICPNHLAGTILGMANRHSATFLYASPMHYRLLSADTSGIGFRTLKHAVSTSSALPGEISADFFKRYGLPIKQAYGIIEIGIPLINIDRPMEQSESVGRPLPCYEVGILNDLLLPVKAGDIGHLAFRGPGMFAGYLNPPTSTSRVFSNGWFLSGDQAVQDSEGYVTIVGRTKSVINVAGNKVFPEEVESVINRHPGVETSSISGRPHPQIGETVHADVVLKDTKGGFDEEEFMRFCRTYLTSYKAPQSVAVVKEINKTLSGKISRIKDQ